MKYKIKRMPFSCERDGLTLRGYEYRPSGDKLPIAIVSHGFMANLTSVKHYAKMMAKLGYAAFCFDFSGGCAILGKSDGRSTDMSVLTETSDLASVINHAKSLPYTDPSNILLLGCSQGGLVSAIVAAERAGEINKLVLFYPALCIPDDARRGKMMFAKFDPENLPKTFRCGPMRLGDVYVKDVINMDPYEKIRNYPGDVLIIHGTKDGIVNLSYSERAIEEYESRQRRGKARLVKIDGGRHIFARRHDKIAINHVKAFLKGE